jgi:rod shape-determining protein MreC
VFAEKSRKDYKLLMKNLINFLIHHSGFFVFLLLEVLSLILVFNSRDYQKSVFLSSSNTIVSSFYNWNNYIVGFFNLSKSNQQLAEENTQLKNQLLDLQNKLEALQPSGTDSLSYKIPPEKQYRFIEAKVINNSTNKLQNYITLNKGALDGVKPDMGVINDEGIVGIVKNVSEHFSVVIPVLNPKIQINCKFKRNNYIGSLVWDGKDYRFASLTDIARHVPIKMGDTLVTSGLTTTFPEGIPVGTIENFNLKESDAYYEIKVKLATNFRTLSYVKVIDFKNAGELKELEKTAYEE